MRKNKKTNRILHTWFGFGSSLNMAQAPGSAFPFSLVLPVGHPLHFVIRVSAETTFMLGDAFEYLYRWVVFAYVNRSQFDLFFLMSRCIGYDILDPPVFIFSSIFVFRLTSPKCFFLS